MSDRVAAGGFAAAATTARAWLAALNAQDTSALRAMLAPDFAWHDGGAAAAEARDAMPGASDAAAAIVSWCDWFVATPDLAFELVCELEGPGWSVLQVVLRGTRRGAESASFASRPRADDAGRPLAQPGCAVIELRGQLIGRVWTYWRPVASGRTSGTAFVHGDF